MNYSRCRSITIFIAAFAAPVVLLFIVLLRLGVTPFGAITFLRVDMNQQYSAFLTYLRSIVQGENDLFYSFSMNGGGNFYFLFAYYLANPINWMMAFVPMEMIPDAITWLILLRFGLCGLAMCCYLYRIKPESFGWGTLLFSTSYALMSFTLVCAENYFFLDGVILLPFVLIGIEDIFERKTFTAYALALGSMLLIQFYFGYMVCLFSVLYFLFKWLLIAEKNGPDWIAARRFFIGSLIAGMVAAIILVPTFRALGSSVKSPPETISFLETKFPFFDLVGRMRTGAYMADDWKEGLPNVYSGALVTVLFVCFFGLKSVGRREKVLTFGVLILLWLSFVFFWLELAWHGFGIPQWWHYRNAFLFSFWMIRAAYLVFSRIQLQIPRLRMSGLIVLVLLNLSLNAAVILSENLSESKSAASYAAHIREMKPILRSLASDDGTFKRIENLAMRDTNDPMRLGYQGLTHYSSTVGSETVLFPLRRLGIEQRHYQTRFTDGTPLATVSLFGIQNVIDKDARIVSISTALPVAFLAPRSIIRFFDFEYLPYENLNRLYPLLSGMNFGSIYSPIETVIKTKTAGGTVWTLPITSVHPIYMYTAGNDTLPNRVEGSSYTDQVTFLTDESILLGLKSSGETMRLISLPGGGINGTDEAADRIFYSEDREILARYAEVIQARGFDLEKIASSYLRTEYTSDNGEGYLFFSILYDEGWRAYVDGEERLIIPALKAFMMIQADAGTHTVELRYTPPGFKESAVISIFGVLIWLVSAVYVRLRQPFP